MNRRELSDGDRAGKRDRVLVLDPDSETEHVYRVDQPPRVLQGDDDLTLPDLQGDFRVAASRFFA